jgi:hypothetical protein
LFRTRGTARRGSLSRADINGLKPAQEVLRCIFSPPLSNPALHDVMRMYQLLGGGQKDAGWMRENMVQNRLAIIPNRTHYDIFLAPELVPTALPFLNGETALRSWEEFTNARQ